MLINAMQEVARGLLDKHRPCPAHSGGGSLCPVSWVLPDLLGIIAEHHAEPVERLRPAIRQVIVEQAFACPSDAVIDPDQDETIDAQVDLLIVVLEQARRQATAREPRPRMSAAPQMCG